MDTLQPTRSSQAEFGLSVGIKIMVRFFRKGLPGETSCRLPLESHLQGTQRWQTCWYLSMLVEGLSSRLARTLAQEDLMRTAPFGPGGYEHLLLHVEVQESCRMQRATQRMAQEELLAMEQGSLCALLQKIQGFHIAVQDHQRRGRETVNQAVFESSVRQRNEGDDNISGLRK